MQSEIESNSPADLNLQAGFRLPLALVVIWQSDFRRAGFGGGSDRSLQRDHAHPKHRLVADVDVVFAGEVEPAVAVDPEDGQARWYDPQGCAVLHRERHDVRGDQQAAAWIDMKCPAVNAAAVDVLEQARLAGRRVDRVYSEIVFSAGEDALALEFRGC